MKKTTKKKAEYNLVTGARNDVIKPLAASLKIFLTKYNSVKVGITGRNPQVRFDEHIRDRKWNRMIVKYKTSSEKFANQIEDLFIEEFPNLKNYWIGNSRITKGGDNYLYFLLYGKKQKSKK